MEKSTVWLRRETKAFEARSCLTPKGVRTLVDSGVNVFVETCNQRCFSDDEYLKAGAELVYKGDFHTAPEDALIIGLKELPESSKPIKNDHLYFAHAFKGQTGAKELLSRFVRGRSIVYDLEFLRDVKGDRVAAFGKWAGFVGAALAIDIWCHRQYTEDYRQVVELKPWSSKKDLINSINRKLLPINKRPKVVVIGGSGRCGKGAKELLKFLGIEDVTSFGKKQTKSEDINEQLKNFDVIINCVYASKGTSPFLTLSDLDNPGAIQVISDVSCDPGGAYNTLPLYDEATKISAPVEYIRGGVALTAIDHLPSLLPRESSEEFEASLMPHLLDFIHNGMDVTELVVWKTALDWFESTLNELETNVLNMKETSAHID